MADDNAPAGAGYLEVPGNRLYWEEWGNPDGIPALYLHGGPGGTLSSSWYRHRFDLEQTRVISFEQRGCGRSTPHAADAGTSLSENTTAALIDDIEALRRHRGVEAWIVNGASWGCTLALAYAQAYPERVLALVSYAVTTTSRREVDWITEGVGAIFPEAWDRLAAYAERCGIGYRRGETRLVEAYRQLMESADPRVRDEASQEWALWEDTHIAIGAGGFSRDPRWAEERFRHAFVRLAVHYWAHDGFVSPPILDRMDRLAGIPATLIHGRRDISSPMETAWALHTAWPGSQLIVDEGNGHGGASMSEEWRGSNDRYVEQLMRQIG